MAGSVHDDGSHSILLMKSSQEAHCPKGSPSGRPLAKSMIQRKRKGTYSLWMFPELPAWLSFYVKRKGLWDESQAEDDKLEYSSFKMTIYMDRGSVEMRLTTVLLRLKNYRNMPKYRACNLSNATIRYKLHGAEPRPAKQDKARGNSWEMWEIRWRRELANRLVSKCWRMLCFATESWWWSVIVASRSAWRIWESCPSALRRGDRRLVGWWPAWSWMWSTLWQLLPNPATQSTMRAVHIWITSLKCEERAFFELVCL